MKILAIDLGKVKSVACDYESQTAAHQFETVRTEPAILEDLFRRRSPDRVVIEVGPAAGWVTDLASRMKIELQVANPSHQAWRWRGVKNKTDRVDAVKLAQLSVVNQLPLVKLPSKKVREWRSLIHYRHSPVARRTMIKNTIHAILNRQAISMPSGKRAWTNAGRKWLESQARVGDDPAEFWMKLDPTEWWRGQLAEELRQLCEVDCSISSVEKKLDAYAATKQQVKRLRSTPGVGPRLGEAVVAIIDDPQRFKNGRQVAAYAGLVPRVFQSGKMGCMTVSAAVSSVPSSLGCCLSKGALFALKGRNTPMSPFQGLSSRRSRSPRATPSLFYTSLPRLWYIGAV
jgi:transposase